MGTSKKAAYQSISVKNTSKDLLREKENNSMVCLKKRSDPSMIACMSMSTSGDFFKSEHTHQFVWHNDVAVDSIKSQDVILRSEIKDKKLMKMKDTFKALAMQR
jgi:hypothetical protein